MSCNCSNPALNDADGVKTLKELYAKEGTGGLTFVEKMTNNLAAVGTGALIGGVCIFAGSKLLGKKGRK